METQKKAWWMSKAIWTAVTTVAVGVARYYGVPIPAEVYALLGAVGLYSLRVGDKPIQ
jgi:hypothetical protein